MEQYIIVKGAIQHNLKDINIKIPKNKLVVMTGPSGSGKSSLAFDTIYAEGNVDTSSLYRPLQDNSWACKTNLMSTIFQASRRLYQ